MLNELRQSANNQYQLPYEYIAEIIDNKDPLDRGRLKCKIFGITEDTLSINQPWCETKGDIFGANKETIGISSVPNIGSLVYIKFLYGNPQYPIVDGYVRGDKDSSLLHTIKELSNTISQTREDNLIGPELPPLNSSSIYPDNNVIETETAVIEIDDTSNNKRISIQHKNGSYFELRPDGTVQIKAKGNAKVIVDGDLDEYINGNITKTVTGNEVVNISGSRTTNIGSTETVTSGGNMAHNAPAIHHN